MSSEVNDTSHDYCINKAIPNGSNLYYATLFETDKNKNIIITLHAFLNELSEIIVECSDPGVARIKLHWWQEEIERLYNNEARHPVTKQMQASINFDERLKTTFYSVIELLNHFIFIEQTDSLETILSLYESTMGEIWCQCYSQLHPDNSDSLKTIRDLGALVHFINCLQQPKTYINETRCIIPANFISNNELLNLYTDTSNKLIIQKERFSPLLIELKNRLDVIYKVLKTTNNKHLQHILIMNRLASKTCDEIINEGCNLLGSNTSLTPLRKLGIGWWTRYVS